MFRRLKSLFPILACMIAGLIVVLFLPENFFLLFSIIYLTFNSWSSLTQSYFAAIWSTTLFVISIIVYFVYSAISFFLNNSSSLSFICAYSCFSNSNFTVSCSYSFNLLSCEKKCRLQRNRYNGILPFMRESRLNWRRNPTSLPLKMSISSAPCQRKSMF